MSGGDSSTIVRSPSVSPLAAISLRTKRWSTAKRLGIAIRFPLRSAKLRYGDSFRTMITAADRCPRGHHLDGHTLVGKVHGHRREHHGGFDLAGNHRFLQLGPSPV